MHWDQMTATIDKLYQRAARVHRGVGQLGVLESVLDATAGPWLGVLDADGRGTAELKMHLAGRYRLTVVVSGAGKITLIRMHTPEAERVLATKPALRRGWSDATEMPAPATWIDYIADWVRAAGAHVDRRAVLNWRLAGAEPALVAMNDTIGDIRASLLEREQQRDELARDIAAMRAELDSLTVEPVALVGPH